MIYLLPFIQLWNYLFGIEEHTVAKPPPPVALPLQKITYVGNDLPEVIVTVKKMYMLEWRQAAYRTFGKHIDPVQLNHLIRAWDTYGSKDNRHLAYIFASIWHECHFVPKDERRANPYRQPALYRQQSRYWPSGYYGRGPIQVTWERNYRRFESFFRKPLLRQPELMNEPEIGYAAAVIGMVRGWFTGAPLSRYINDRREDYINARRTVNGDVAKNGAKIARHAQQILAAFNQIKKENHD